MRCPKCGVLRDPIDRKQLKRFDLNEEFADELAVVYKCVESTGGCGHVFAPADMKIIRAFLAGDLVPRAKSTTNGGTHA